MRNVENAKAAPACAPTSGQNRAVARNRTRTDRRSVAMWSRCNSAQRRMSGFIASGSKAASFSAHRARSRRKIPRRECRRLSRPRRSRNVSRAAASVASRLKSLMTAYGGVKVPMKFFWPKRIQAVFHPHAGIGLAQRGRRDAHQPHAAMGGGGGKSGHVQQRAAADGDEIRMPVKVVALELRVNFRDQRGGIFGAFAAAGKQRRTHEAHLRRVGGKIIFDLAFEPGHAPAPVNLPE